MFEGSFFLFVVAFKTQDKSRFEDRIFIIYRRCWLKGGTFTSMLKGEKVCL